MIRLFTLMAALGLNAVPVFADPTQTDNNSQNAGVSLTDIGAQAGLQGVAAQGATTQGAMTQGTTPLNSIDEYKPILVDGTDIPAALGKHIDTLSLQAVIDDQLEPIPYQIDEYNTGGAVYIEGWKAPLEGKKNIVDGNDKLLFLYKDAGPRRTAEQRSDGKIIAEIELADTNKQTRYVYLVEGSRLQSDTQYVRYSTDVGKVETDFYQLVYNKENQLNWDEFAYTTFTGEKPFDTMKIRIQGGLLTDLATVKLDNNNIIAKIKGEHVGPIRTTSQLELTVWYLGIPAIDISYQVHHYPKSMLYDARVVIPEIRRMLATSPKLSMSLDANNLRGAELRTALGPQQSAIIDGAISALEQQYRKASATADQNWIWLTTKRNLDVLAFFDYVGDQREPISLVYNDSADTANPPERFRGEMPNIGYEIENFPDSGFFGVVVSVYLSEGFPGKPENFTQAVRELPAIRVMSP